MKGNRNRTARRPFQRLSAREWANLIIVGLAAFWLAQIAFEIGWGNIFGRFASDAAAFWSAGYIANHYGYARAYDLELLARVQQPLLALIPSGPFIFHPSPAAYLPIFLLPFQLLAVLAPLPAASLWILINTLGTVLYLRAFHQRAIGHPVGFRTLALFLVSAPVFLNLFTGQVNLLLMIGAGEYLLCAARGKPLQAGLWLGLLLIKPQYLFLWVPALLLQREGRALLGLALSAALILGTSLLLAGSEALLGPARLWLEFASGPGLPTNDVSLMMNWRMVGALLAGLSSQPLVWIMAIPGMLLTIAVALALWTRPLKAGSLRYLVALLGLLAATCAVAWHSHVHAAMIMIPVLLVLQAKHADVVGNLVEWWALLPAALYVLRLVLAALLYSVAAPGELILFVDSLAGIGLFIMNLVMLGWSVRIFRAPRVSEA